MVATHEVDGHPQGGVEEARAVDGLLLAEDFALEVPRSVGYGCQDAGGPAEQAERPIVRQRRHAELPSATRNGNRALEEQPTIVVAVA